ncbi:MAG: hypothetical protein FWG61_07620 [Firmicutes bacterium]|nr:hypothetical protein [Bacillota bacterium]
MKRVFAILLLTVIALGFAAGCSGNKSINDVNYPPKVTETPPPEEIPSLSEQAGLENKKAAPYIDAFARRTFYLKYSIEMAYYDQTVKTITEVAAMGGEISIKNSVGFVDTADTVSLDNTEGLTVYKENKAFSIDHKNKTVTVTPSSLQISTMFPDSGYIFEESGLAELFGISYNYEDYYTNSIDLRFYFDENKLVGLERLTSNMTPMLVLEMSTDIPAGIFDIPAEYTVLEGK